MSGYTPRGECLNAVAMICGKIQRLAAKDRLLQAEAERQGLEIDRLRETVAVMREKIARLEGCVRSKRGVCEW